MGKSHAHAVQAGKEEKKIALTAAPDGVEEGYKDLDSFCRMNQEGNDILDRTMARAIFKKSL